MARHDNQKLHKLPHKRKHISIILSLILTAIMMLSSVNAYAQMIDDSFLYYEGWQDSDNITIESINADSLSFSLDGTFKYFVDSQNKIFYCCFYVTETSISGTEYDARVLINFHSSGNSYLLSVNKNGICDTIEYLRKMLTVKQSFSVSESNFATFIVAVDYSKIVCEAIDVDLYTNGHKYIIKKGISLIEVNDVTEEADISQHNDSTFEGSYDIHSTEPITHDHSTDNQDYSNYHNTEEMSHDHLTAENGYENHVTSEHATIDYSEQYNSTKANSTVSSQTITSTAQEITTMSTKKGVEMYTNPTTEKKQYTSEIATNPTTQMQASEVIGGSNQAQQNEQIKTAGFSGKSKALFISGGVIGGIAILFVVLSLIIKKPKP